MARGPDVAQVWARGSQDLTKFSRVDSWRPITDFLNFVKLSRHLIHFFDFNFSLFGMHEPRSLFSFNTVFAFNPLIYFDKVQH